MPSTPGISLVGFMGKPAGIDHLRRVCIYEGDQSDSRLEHEWTKASRRIGNPMGRMGMPEIREIPDSQRAYVEELTGQSWLQQRLEKSLPGAVFKMIEVDPLLAMQFSIDLDRTGQVCRGFGDQQTEDALFLMCLPHVPPDPQVHHYQDHTNTGSMLVMTKNLSFGVVREGRHEVETAEGYKLLVGVELTVPLPLVHVVRYDNRCYLHNGFHRAYGARKAGATHIPCVFREVTHPNDIGIGQDTFSLSEMNSGNPPTVGHYTNDRAYNVQLRSLTRFVQVSWSQYTI